MKKYIIVLILSVLNTIGQAQEVLLEQDVKKDSVESKTGPNKKHYAHLYTSYGFFVSPSSQGSKINHLASNDYKLGLRYKLKITNWEAIGLDICYNSNSFNLIQSGQKTLPNKTLHDKEKLITNSISADAYNRINFGKRGNIIGKFIDIGFYFDYIIAAKHVYKDTFNSVNSAFATKHKVVNRGLTYLPDYNSGAIIRIGNNRYALFAQYRLTKYFKSGFNFADMPNIIAGIQIGLHK